MKLPMLFTTTACAFALSLPASTAPSGCPSSVTTTALKAHPGARLSSCQPEEDEGQTQFEITLVAKDGKQIELDVAPDGKILVTEEPVDPEDVPPAVLDAFRAKYPNAQVTSATAETCADGAVSYELEFAIEGNETEATFASDGTFLEEE